MVIHFEPYVTRTVYIIEAEIKTDRERALFFPSKREIHDPYDTLEIVRFLKDKKISFQISRTILFERNDGKPSDEKPSEDKISIDRLERIVNGLETLPKWDYPVFT